MRNPTLYTCLLLFLTLSISPFLCATSTEVTYSGTIYDVDNTPDELTSLLGQPFTATLRYNTFKGLYQDYGDEIFIRYKYGTISNSGFIFTVNVGDYVFSLESGTSGTVEAYVKIIENSSKMEFTARVADDDKLPEPTFDYSKGFERINMQLVDNSDPFELFSEFAFPTEDGDINLGAANDGSPPTLFIYTATEFNSEDYWRIAGEVTDLQITTVSDGTWAGYEIVNEAGDVDTGDLISWINVTAAPWIYSYSVNGWVYCPEINVTESGGWAYFVK